MSKSESPSSPSPHREKRGALLLVLVGTIAGAALSELRHAVATSGPRPPAVTSLAEELAAAVEAHKMCELSKRRIERERLQSPLPSPTAPPLPGESARAVAAPETHTRPRSEAPDPLAAASTLSEIAQLIALSAEDQNAISSTLRGKNGRVTTAEIVKEALGETRFAEYLDRQLQFRKEMRREANEKDVFTLSRRLNLTPTQEESLQKIVAASRESFFPLTRDDAEDAVTKSLGSAEAARALLSQEEARQRWLATQLRDILSDAQYNTYLQIAESTAARRSHSTFLAVTEPSATPK